METRENVEAYKTSLLPIESMLLRGLITDKDFIKAEDFLAKKYCIKKGSIYRSNDLINKATRVIDILPEQEVVNDGKENNNDRSVTEIRKEN